MKAGAVSTKAAAFTAASAESIRASVCTVRSATAGPYFNASLAVNTSRKALITGGGGGWSAQGRSPRISADVAKRAKMPVCRCRKVRTISDNRAAKSSALSLGATCRSASRARAASLSGGGGSPGSAMRRLTERIHKNRPASSKSASMPAAAHHIQGSTAEAVGSTGGAMSRISGNSSTGGGGRVIGYSSFGESGGNQRAGSLRHGKFTKVGLLVPRYGERCRRLASDFINLVIGVRPGV